MAEGYGFDVSKWQDGAYAGGGGFSFALAKFTEGIGYLDPAASRHLAAFVAHGLVPGGYHFARPDLNPGTAGAYGEADWFWRVATSLRPGALGLLMNNDLETGSGPLGTWRDDFNGRLSWRLGGAPTGWYSYWNFIGHRALNYASPYWAWLAWPSSNGPLPAINFSVAMQQDGLTSVPGIAGGVDFNRFFGTLEQLHRLTVGGHTGDEPMTHEERLDIGRAMATVAYELFRLSGAESTATRDDWAAQMASGSFSDTVDQMFFSDEAQAALALDRTIREKFVAGELGSPGSVITDEHIVQAVVERLTS